MGKNKAKTAVLVAVEAKPEVEKWRRPKKSTFFLLTPSDSFLLGHTIVNLLKGTATELPQ